MSNIVLKGSTSGDVTITVPAAAGTNTVTIPAATGTLPLSNLDHVTNRPNVKPLVINGDMNIAQRATSVTGSTAGGYTTVDRMLLSIGTLGTWTIAQTASAPDDTGLTNSYRLDCTTADASPAAGDYAIFSTRLEGQDVQLFKKGTSYAEKMTVSFWVKSNKTGTYIMELDDNDNSRNINQAYTISSADTWEKKILSFDGDTTGAFGNDNGSSLQILWWLGAGSNFTSGSLQTAWAGTDNTKRAVGQVNLADNTANDWSITGIQLEVGEFDVNSIAPFQHESFGDNLIRCQRYYQHTYDYGTSAGTSTAVGFVGCNAAGTGIGRVLHGLPIRPSMRAIPTITVYSTDGTSGTAKRGDAGTNVAAGTGNASRNAFHVENSAGVTDGEQIQFQYRLVSEI